MLRKRRENFACETILFREGLRKLLKSLGREMSDFAVSCDIKGLRPILFRAFIRRPFSDPPVGAKPQSSFSEFIDNTNSISRKAKRRVPELHMSCGFTESII